MLKISIFVCLLINLIQSNEYKYDNGVLVLTDDNFYKALKEH